MSVKGNIIEHFQLVDLNESVSSTKKGVLSTHTCSYMKLEATNENNRWYGREIATKKILTKKVMDKLKRGQALLGEINHPADRFSTDMDYVAIATTDLWYNEELNEVWGTFDILDTPRGRIVQTLVDYGFPIGISARAVGDTKVTRRGKEVDVDKYIFKTFDAVVDPGFATSRINQGLDESLMVLCESLNESELLIAKPLIDSIKNTCDSIYKDESGSDSPKDSWEDELIHSLYEESSVKLDGANTLIQVLKEELANKDKVIQSMSNKIGLLNEAIKDVETLREDNKRINTELRSKIKHLETLNENLNSQLVSMETELNESYQYIEELETLREDNNELKTNLESRLDEAYNLIEDLQSPKKPKLQLDVVSIINESVNEKTSVVIDETTDRILKRLNKK